MRLSEVKDTKFVAILYGKPKTGKTVLASQFPSPWFLDMEKGLGSVTTIRNVDGLSFDFDVTVINDDKSEDEDFLNLCGKAFAKQDGWTKLKKMSEALISKMPEDSTLVIDSLTKAGELLIGYIKKTSGHKQLQIQDWGTFKEEMLFWFNGLFRGKCNVIVVAHEQIVKDELTGAIERTLLLPGQSSQRLPSVVDEFWYLVKQVTGKTIKRILQSDGDRITAAGSRCWMPNIEAPSYEKMKPYLEKSLDRKLPEPTWTPK